ncbi:MAG: hypothetical protein WA702_16625 [Bradyrhizobium sp.]|jgi:hypothetical protein|uniref:hypothetical protein n=1 Tax=Bradyrhizobium sp. TaxID=376 RepID=UPI003C7B351D
MKDRTLGVIALGVVAVGAAWTVHTLTSTDYYCPGPSATSVVALLAPCQAFDTALGHTVSGGEAVRIGLRWGAEPDQAKAPFTQFAEK